MGIRTALPICLLALTPLGARGATLTVTEASTFDSGGASDEVINIQECLGNASSSLSLSWTIDALPVASTVYRTFVTKGACSDSTGLIQVGSDAATNQLATGTQSGISVRNDIISPLLTSSISCAPASSTTALNLCVKTFLGSADQSQTATTSLVLDTRVPAAPVNLAVDSGDTALAVRWTQGTNGAVTADSYTATATDGTNTFTCDSTVGSTTSCKITGLQNNVTYTVSVVARSAARNVSATSTTVTGTPIPVDDFWRTYRKAGGREEGGCGHPGAGLLGLLGLLPLALRRRTP
jgi:hypothetical protein